MKRNIRITIALALALATAGCSSEETGRTGNTGGPKPLTKVETPAPDSAAFQSSVLLSASWGPVKDEVAAPKPPTPTIVSYRKGQQQKFEREAGKRWKNTEIFVAR